MKIKILIPDFIGFSSAAIIPFTVFKGLAISFAAVMIGASVSALAIRNTFSPFAKGFAKALRFKVAVVDSFVLSSSHCRENSSEKGDKENSNGSNLHLFSIIFTENFGFLYEK